MRAGKEKSINIKEGKRAHYQVRCKFLLWSEVQTSHHPCLSACSSLIHSAILLATVCLLFSYSASPLLQFLPPYWPSDCLQPWGGVKQKGPNSHWELDRVAMQGSMSSLVQISNFLHTNEALKNIREAHFQRLSDRSWKHQSMQSLVMAQITRIPLREFHKQWKFNLI